MTSETLLFEECAHSVAEVGVDHNVVALNLFPVGQFDTAGATPIQENTGYRA